MDFDLPECGLIGANGNALSLIAAVRSTLKSFKFTPEMNDLGRIATAGDYDHVLQTLLNFVEPVHVGEALLSRGDCTAEDFGQTPLHSPSFKQQHLNEFEVNARNCYGRTPIFYMNDAAQITQLLENGALLDVKDNFDMTPFHVFATRPRLLEACLASMDSTVEVANAMSKFGETPLEIIEWHFANEGKMYLGGRVNSKEILRLMDSYALLNGDEKVLKEQMDLFNKHALLKKMGYREIDVAMELYVSLSNGYKELASGFLGQIKEYFGDENVSRMEKEILLKKIPSNTPARRREFGM